MTHHVFQTSNANLANWIVYSLNPGVLLEARRNNGRSVRYLIDDSSGKCHQLATAFYHTKFHQVEVPRLLNAGRLIRRVFRIALNAPDGRWTPGFGGGFND